MAGPDWETWLIPSWIGLKEMLVRTCEEERVATGERGRWEHGPRTDNLITVAARKRDREHELVKFFFFPGGELKCLRVF
jgi:hypothetical protein